MTSGFYELNADVQQPITFHSYRHEANPTQDAEECVGLHFHTAIEIVFVESGRYRARVDGNAYTLTRGDILFVNPHLPHSFEKIGDTVIHTLLVQEPLFQTLNFPKKLPRIVRADGKNSYMLRLFKEAASVWEQQSEQYKIGFLYSLCGALLRYYPLSPLEGERQEEQFLDVLKYIEEHFREPLTLEELTQKFGYSKSYFSRTFNKVTDVNLREFLNRRRITEALRIKESNPSLAWVHIATNVGFESWSTFSRAYKRYYNKNDLDKM